MILITPMLLKGLGEPNFAIYGVLLNLVILFSIIDFGANLGMIRKVIHQADASRQLIPTLFYFYIGLSLILIPVLYFYLSFSMHWGESNLLYAIVIAAIVATNICIILFDSVLQSLHYIYVTKIIRALKTLIEFVGWIIFIQKGSIFHLLLVTLTINIAYLFILYWTVNKKFTFSLSIRQFKFHLLFEHIQYSIWYFIAAISTGLIYNIQLLLFNQLTSAVLVAHFFVVTKFYEIIRVAASNFSQVLFPHIIQLESEQNWDAIRKTYLASVIKSVFFALIIAAVLFLFGNFVFIKWSKLNDPITLQLFHAYALFIIFIIVDNVSVIYLAALKLNAWPTVVSLLQGIMSAIVSFYFINWYGLLGAFYASMLCFMLTNMLFNPLYLLKKIEENRFNYNS